MNWMSCGIIGRVLCESSDILEAVENNYRHGGTSGNKKRSDLIFPNRDFSSGFIMGDRP